MTRPPLVPDAPRTPPLEGESKSKVNPRTVWFVGYTDNRMGTDEYVLTQQDRTFFTKVGYAWTF